MVLFQNPKFNPTHHNPGYIIQNRAIDTDDVYVIVLELDGAREKGWTEFQCCVTFAHGGLFFL